MSTAKTSETSVDLLAYMALYREVEPEEAQEAFNEFYLRYSRFLTVVVTQNCPKGSAYYDESLVEATVNNTFIKSFLHADTFNIDGDEDGAMVERRVKAWLSSIAKNELRQLLRTTIPYLKNHQLSDDFASSEHLESLAYLRDDEPTCFERSLIDRALASLSERERDVLITYTRFEDGKKQLPKDELERLASFYDTTSDNLRQIKFRAFKKVKDFIKANSEFAIE